MKWSSSITNGFLLNLMLVIETSAFLGFEIQYCFDQIGCIVTDKDFYDPLRRVLNPPPYARNKTNVAFTVHTRLDRKGTQVAAFADPIHVLKNTLFDPKYKVKVLIHGYLDSEGVTWYPQMVEALLNSDNFNVITVNWKGGSKTTYTQAAVNARVVGLEVAYLVNYLIHNSTVLPKDVHLIGHSLGAHVAGYAGERIRALGRITGLDPAGFLFQHLPPRVRLDPSDANFVDVIHTDISPLYKLGLGHAEPLGHLDFYPNGGLDQTGCPTPFEAGLTIFKDGIDYFEGLTPEQKDYVTCSHSRSTKLFTDSISSKQCSYIAYNCESYEKFQERSCLSCGLDATLCATMGIKADLWAGVGQPSKEHIKMYLTTGSGPQDYCL